MMTTIKKLYVKPPLRFMDTARYTNLCSYATLSFMTHANPGGESA